MFGLYEVKSLDIYKFMLDYFPNHSVFITEWQQSQEIAVACRNSFEEIKFQQKNEFKSVNPKLWHGAFFTFKRNLKILPRAIFTVLSFLLILSLTAYLISTRELFY